MLSKRIVFNTAIILLALISLNSCFFEGYGRFDRIQGEGSTVSKEIDIPKVHGIVVRNSAIVRLKQGDNQTLELEAQRNIIENLKTEVSNGILYISNKRPVWRTRPVEVKLILSDLTLVKLSGSGEIITSNKFSDLAAESKFLRGENVSIIKIFVSPLSKFIKEYFIKLGILDGIYGFTISIISSPETFLKYIKLYQKNHS